jgi:hypothetical protein
VHAAIGELRERLRERAVDVDVVARAVGAEARS